jgi:hypothetical protein
MRRLKSGARWKRTVVAMDMKLVEIQYTNKPLGKLAVSGTRATLSPRIPQRMLRVRAPPSGPPSSTAPSMRSEEMMGSAKNGSVAGEERSSKNQAPPWRKESTSDMPRTA